MNKAAIVLAALCSMFVFSPSYAIDVYEPGYSVEIYAVYSQSAGTRGMTFDFSGNLYVTHYPPAAV